MFNVRFVQVNVDRHISISKFILYFTLLGFLYGNSLNPGLGWTSLGIESEAFRFEGKYYNQYFLIYRHFTMISKITTEDWFINYITPQHHSTLLKEPLNFLPQIFYLQSTLNHKPCPLKKLVQVSISRSQ